VTPTGHPVRTRLLSHVFVMAPPHDGSMSKKQPSAERAARLAVLAYGAARSCMLLVEAGVVKITILAHPAFLPPRQSNRAAARLPRLKRSPAVCRGLNLLGQQVEPALMLCR